MSRVSFFPEGDVESGAAMVLTLAVCGHLTYRPAGSVLHEPTTEHLQACEHFWEKQPCERCEPAYVVALVDRALELLTEETWCRGVYALRKFRQPVAPWDDRAVRWSMIGALIRARHEIHHVTGVPQNDPTLWKAGMLLCVVATGRLNEQMDELIEDLQEWEMRPGRTLLEVRQALENVRGEALTALAQIAEVESVEHEHFTTRLAEAVFGEKEAAR